jgi:hypothetical protein
MVAGAGGKEGAFAEVPFPHFIRQGCELITLCSLVGVDVIHAWQKQQEDKTARFDHD